MAGTNIGPLTLKIMANAEGMSATLGRASVSINAWAINAARTFAKVTKSLSVGVPGGMAKGGMASSIVGGLGNVKAGIEKAMGDPGRFLAENVVGGLGAAVGRIPKVGALLALPIELAGGAMSYALDQFDKGSESLKMLGAASARTGIGMNDLKAIMIAAGPASEMAEKAIFKLQQHVMNAARGSESAKAAFFQLGISTDGIAKVKTIDLLKQISDRFAALPAGAAKSAAAFDLFGKNGLAMMPMLAEGSTKITKSQGLVAQFGLGGDENGLAMVKKVAEAKKTMALFSEGMTNGITLGVAPILLTISEYMGKFGLTTNNVKGWVLDAFDVIGTGIAYTWDILKTGWDIGRSLWPGFKLGCQVAAVAILEFGASALESLAKVGQKVAEVVMMLAKIDPVTNLSMKGMKALGIDIEGMAKGGAAAAMGGNMAAGLREAAERGRGMIKTTKDDLLKIWGNPNESAVNGFKGFMDRVRQIAAQTGGAAGNSLSEALAMWGPKIQEMQKQFDGPLGVFKEKVGEINAIWQTGLLQFNPGFRLQAVGAEFQKLAAGMNLPQKKFAGAAMKDSTEAYSAIVNHQFGDQNMSVQERMRQILEEQSARQLDQIRIGQEMLDAMKKDPTILKGLQ
jgi:hypothetical protein